jgi:hypothetical protein
LPAGKDVTVVAQGTGIYEPSPRESVALRQGEILSGLVQQFLNLEELRKGELVVDDIRHPFVIVVSQSCDLEWDFEARRASSEPDKMLPHVFLCEALTAQEVRSRRSSRGDVINNSRIWTPLKRNKDERFHFLEAVPPLEDAASEGLPELVVDFKRYFSLPTPELYWRLAEQAKRRTRLKNPYLEHFSTRFFQYQARVATPRQHFST